MGVRLDEKAEAEAKKKKRKKKRKLGEAVRNGSLRKEKRKAERFAAKPAATTRRRKKSQNCHIQLLYKDWNNRKVAMRYEKSAAKKQIKRAKILVTKLF